MEQKTLNNILIWIIAGLGVLIIVLLLFISLRGAGQTGPSATSTSERDIYRAPQIPQDQSDLKKVAEANIEQIKKTDFAELEKYAHPQKGLRFSPYGYIDTNTARIVSKSRISELTKDTKKYVWGYFDGSGDVISMTFDEYYDKFIYDKDFASAPQTSVNQFLGRGNTLNNISDVYPGSSFVEFYFPGSEKYDGMDWKSLRLVYQKIDDKWFIVAIVHDEWTT